MPLLLIFTTASEVNILKLKQSLVQLQERLEGCKGRLLLPLAALHSLAALDLVLPPAMQASPPLLSSQVSCWTPSKDFSQAACTKPLIKQSLAQILEAAVYVFVRYIQRQAWQRQMTACLVQQEPRHRTHLAAPKRHLGIPQALPSVSRQVGF